MRTRLWLSLLVCLLLAPYGARAYCGDGAVDGAEQCDTAGPSTTCDYDCTFVQCGDGVVNPFAGEQCDDGNQNPNDGCAPTCQYSACIQQAPAFPGWAAIAGASLLTATAAVMLRRRTAI
jgi:cysteine-rich repeat protein